jgi:hypothetical protein
MLLSEQCLHSMAVVEESIGEVVWPAAAREV